ncbi:MAG: acyltransferase [Alphaproteobacteria bacterium]|nr:acyltransferase [Alphaproteobacteria bacterium]
MSLGVSPATQPKQRLSEIDGIRGWAACIVLMQHFVTIYAKLFPELNHPTFILLNGALAVQIFFVLSGDALSAAFFATGKRRSIDVLLLKRYPRLTFPILIACLAVYAVNVLGLNFHGQAAPLILRQSWHGAPPDDFGGMIFYSFIRVFLELPTSANVYHPFLWTMRLELIGSLGVFAFLYLLPRLPNPVLLLAGAAGLMFYIAPDFAGFPIGVLFGWLRQRGVFARLNRSESAQIISWVFLAFLTLLTEFLPQSMSVQVLVVFAAAFVGSLYCNTLCLRFFQNSLSRFLGDLSFPLYVMHYAILISLTSFAIVWVQGQLGLTPLTVTGIIFVSLIACLAVAWLVRQIEKPYLRLLDISVKYMLKDK